MASEPQETRFEYASTWLSSRKVLDLQDRYEWKTMRRRSNKPIGSVPAEILVAIFAFLVHRPESRWATPECMLDELDLGMQALIRASQVCRFWRDIILNTSTLWGTFAVGNYPRDRICLQRSRDTPLRVYMPSTNCPFFVELSAHFHRLRELHTEITLPTTSARVSYHLEALYRDSQAPLLECLTVRNRVHHDIFTSNPLKSSFTGQFPGLKRLHTIDLAISLTGQYVITGLTHVKLDGSLVGGVRMDVHDLLEFLQVNPDLKELHLSGALFKQSFECDPQHTPVVPLTGLRKLSMRHFEHSDEIAHILSHLILPPGLAMDLGCSDTNMACGHLLFPPDLSALGNMQRFTHLRIDFTSRYTESVAGEDDETSSSFSCEILHRSYSSTNRQSVIAAITDTLPLEDVEELWITGPRSYWIIPEVPAETWRRLFARMPKLSTLHLERTIHHRQLVAALCLDAAEQDAAMSMPAPHMRTIHFVGDCGLALGSQSLRTLVEERASVTGGFGEVLVATSHNGETLRELCSYLTLYVGTVVICNMSDAAETVTALCSSSHKKCRTRFISV